MDFLNYISAMGVENLAEKLETTTPTIYQWKSFQTAPRPMMAYKLIALSGGLLDFNAIYSPYVNAKIQEQNPNQTKLL